MGTPDLTVRPLSDADRDAVIATAGRSLGWAGDGRDRDFFAWKHDANPFGPSYAIGAFDGDRLAGYRTLLRWQFVRGGQTRSMVRAVDTATDPDYQGQGIFRTLTTRAVDDLTAAGVDAVYNTPNDQSRPGYLKMGWSEVGRPTIQVSPRSPIALVRMARARVASEKWSQDVAVGERIDVVAADLVLPIAGERWATPRTEAFLRWRYGFEPLHYRVIEVRGGHCIFRVRRRGALREVAIVEWLSDRADPRAVRRLVRSCGDYAIGVGLTPRRHAVVPLPKQGPIVTWRTLADDATPALGDMAFSLGDLELF